MDYVKSKKYLFKFAGGFVLFMYLYRLFQLIYYIFKLKRANFSLGELSFDSNASKNFLFSFHSDMRTPININASYLKATTYIKTEDDSVKFLEVNVSDINIAKNGKIGFDSQIDISYVDLTKLYLIMQRQSIFVDLELVLKTRFFLIPLTFNINRTIFEMEKAAESSKIKNEQSKKVNFIDKILDTFGLDLEECQKPGFSLFKSLEHGIVNIDGNEYYKVCSSLKPFFSSGFLKKINIKMADYSIHLVQPLEVTIHISRLFINQDECFLNFCVPIKARGTLIAKVLEKYWHTECIEIEIGKIMHKQSVLYDKESYPSTRDVFILPITQEKNLGLEVRWKAENLIVNHQSISIDFVSFSRDKMLLLSIILHSFAKSFIPDVAVELNNEFVAILKIDIMNPFVKNLNEVELPIFRVILQTSNASKLLIKEKDNTLILKPNTVFSNAPWLNTLYLKIQQNKLLILGFEGSETPLDLNQQASNRILYADVRAVHSTICPGKDGFAFKSVIKTLGKINLQDLFFSVHLPKMVLLIKNPLLSFGLEISDSIIGIASNPGKEVCIYDFYCNIQTELSVLWMNSLGKNTFDNILKLISKNNVFIINNYFQIPVTFLLEAERDTIPTKEKGYFNFDSKIVLVPEFSPKLSSLRIKVDATELRTPTIEHDQGTLERIIYNITNIFECADITVIKSVLGKKMLLTVAKTNFKLQSTNRGVSFTLKSSTHIDIKMLEEKDLDSILITSHTVNLTNLLLMLDFSRTSENLSEKSFNYNDNAIKTIFKAVDGDNLFESRFYMKIPRCFFCLSYLDIHLKKGLLFEFLTPSIVKTPLLLITFKITFDPEFYCIYFSANGRTDLHVDACDFKVFSGYCLLYETEIDKINLLSFLSYLLSENDNSKDPDQKNFSGIFHIQPCSFKAINATQLAASFKLYNEQILDIITGFLNNFLINIPSMSYMPRFFDFNLSIFENSDLCLSIRKENSMEMPLLRLEGPSKICLKSRYDLKKQLRKMKNEKITEIYQNNYKIGNRIYNGCAREAEHLCTCIADKSLEKSLFDFPVEFKFSVSFSELINIKQSDLSGSKISFFPETSKSSICRFLTYLNSIKNKKSAPIQEEKIDCCLCILESSTLFSFLRSTFMINFIGYPLSIFLISPDNVIVQLRLFGLLFDKNICNGKYEIGFPLNVFKSDDYTINPSFISFWYKETLPEEYWILLILYNNKLYKTGIPIPPLNAIKSSLDAIKFLSRWKNKTAMKFFGILANSIFTANDIVDKMRNKENGVHKTFKIITGMSLPGDRYTEEERKNMEADKKHIFAKR
ncbi:hypothetical protein GINT2_002319 [Glugoides intestinalis]